MSEQLLLSNTALILPDTAGAITSASTQITDKMVEAIEERQVSVRRQRSFETPTEVLSLHR